MPWWKRRQEGDAQPEEALSRRDFFRRVGAPATAIRGEREEPQNRKPPPARTLPQRPLGRTGVGVPILGMGTARLTRVRDDESAAALLNEAIDLGVTYIDTATEKGGYERAQLVVGEVMRRRRSEVFLTSKVFEPDASSGRRMLERSLEELQVGQVDLLYAHSLGHDHMDPGVTLGAEGVLRLLREAKSEGLCRFIGATCHNRPRRLLEFLAAGELDVIMTAANFVDVHTYGFEREIWPVARQRGCGLVAMKVFGGPAEGGNTPANMPRQFQDLAFRYALSLEGCATAVVGMLDRRELHENVQRARTFQPLTKEEWERIDAVGPRLAAGWGPHLGEA